MANGIKSTRIQKGTGYNLTLPYKERAKRESAWNIASRVELHGGTEKAEMLCLNERDLQNKTCPRRTVV